MEEKKGDIHIGPNTKAEGIANFLMQRFQNKENAQVYLSDKNKEFKPCVLQAFEIFKGQAPQVQIPKPKTGLF